MIRNIALALAAAAALAFAAPADAQLATGSPNQYIGPAGGALPAGVNNLIGLDSVTSQPCLIGSSSTCQLPVSGGGGGGGGGAITATDGAIVTIGSKADAAAGTGSASMVALLKQLHLDTIAPLAAGSNTIGSIANTGFNITGTLPAFAATPTFSCGSGCYQATQPVSGTFWQATQPVSFSGNVTTIGPTASGSAASTAPVLHGGTLRGSSTGLIEDIAVGLDGGTLLSDAPPEAGRVTATGATYTSPTATFTANSQNIIIDTQGYGGLSFYAGGTFSATLSIYSSDSASGPFVATAYTSSSNIGASADSTTVAASGVQGALNPIGRYVQIATTAYTSGSPTVTVMLRSQRFPNRSVEVSGTTGVSGSQTLADASALTSILRAGLASYNGATLDMLRSAGTANNSTGTGVLGVAQMCQYQSSLPTVTASDYYTAQCTVNGQIETSIYSGTTAVGLSSNGSDASAAANGLAVANYGKLFNNSTWDRQYSTQGAAAAGNAGLGVAAVEEAGRTYSHISTATTTLVKSGKGFLHAISVNTLVASETITLYDNTTGSGTVIAVITLPSTITSDQPFVMPEDLAFTTGLTVVTSGIADLTFNYR